MNPIWKSDLSCSHEHTDLQVLGDKAYISAAKAAQLWQANRIELKTIPRRNQRKQLPRQLYNISTIRFAK